MRLLTPQDGPEAPSCSQQCMDNAMRKLTTPSRQNGMGLTSMSLVGPLAFYASVMASRETDEDLAEHAKGLERFTVETHRMVVDRVGTQPVQSQPRKRAHEDKQPDPSQSSLTTEKTSFSPRFTKMSFRRTQTSSSCNGSSPSQHIIRGVQNSCSNYTRIHCLQE